MAASIELGEVLHDNCLSCSDDCQMAVALKQEVKVIEMNCDPRNTSSEFYFSKYSIPAAKEVLDLDVGLNREDLQPEKGDQFDVASIQLDKTLCPKEISTSKVSSESFYKVAWSKKGCDEHGRCLLACLQWDHRLSISRFLKKAYSAKEVINLCNMLWKIRRKTWTNKTYANKAEKFSEYRRRKMSLAIVDIAWSNILSREESDDTKVLESPPKKQKVLETGPEREPFSFLATAQRDGSVILWKMKTPVTNESDVSIATEIETDYHWPTALRWLHHNQGKVHSKDFLAIGSLTGELGVWQITYKKNQSVTAVRACDLWTEKDDMRIDCIGWIPCETDPFCWYLLTMKAQHVILFLLSIPILEEESTSPVVLSHCIQNSLHTVPSSGLYSCPSFAISCSQDGSLQKVQPCYANNELSTTNLSYQLTLQGRKTRQGHNIKCPASIFRELSVQLDLFEKHPPIGPAHHGCSMTASGVYFGLLTYNHVARSTTLFLRPFADDTLIIDKLKDRTVPLYLKVDCIEFIRCQYMKGEEVDFPWVSTPGDLQAWLDEDGELDEYRLQMKRYLLIFQHSKLAHITMKKRQGSNNKSVVDGLAKKISDCEERLMLLRICCALEKVMTEDVNELSVKLMCDWLRTNQTCYTGNVKDRVEKILNHPVLKNMKSSQCHEICYLCGEKILFQNLWEDSCSNGHPWKRCNLTLLLCQIKTRSCSWCTSKSLFPTDEDCSWVRTLLKQQCVFCGGVYVHQSAT